MTINLQAVTDFEKGDVAPNKGMKLTSAKHKNAGRSCPALARQHCEAGRWVEMESRT